MNAHELQTWLRENDPARLEQLWQRADDVRREHVGDAVHLRGLVEFSNRCACRCAYCGLRADNTRLSRYRMTGEEVLACARHAVQLGYGTVVLQSGEDPSLPADWLANVIRHIKAETPLAVTLSAGQHSEATLAAWRAAGVDRYLMRFETSNAALYDRLHPGRSGGLKRRLETLATLRRLDYELGSGVLVGVPGQTYADLARDIQLFAELALDMIGCGPFIPHGDTPLGRGELPVADPGEQVPASEAMGYKVVALARLTCPDTNIPCTTALATLNREQGRELGLLRGANVVMPNVTPPRYRSLYEIYPAKACLGEAPRRFDEELRRRIETLGRTVGRGRGDSPRRLAARK